MREGEGLRARGIAAAFALADFAMVHQLQRVDDMRGGRLRIGAGPGQRLGLQQDHAMVVGGVISRRLDPEGAIEKLQIHSPIGERLRDSR